MEKIVNDLKALIATLNEANRAYYQEAKEIMTNKEYDDLYDELVSLEAQSGIVFSNSPTRNVGYEVISELPKEVHPSRMLSLDKTKDVNVLKRWLGNKEGVLSWKLDGLTVVLSYENGELVKAVTRGNGEIGELITQNAIHFANVPLTIPYKEELVVRGEAIISYSRFEKINSDLQVKYKNPRNLCSGTVRQLNNEIVAQRRVRFIAFELVTPKCSVVSDSFEFLAGQGFEVVDHDVIDQENFDDWFELYKRNVESMNYPSDGLVLRYNDNAYGESLGTTDKFPKHSLAFKWKDETETTILRDIEWKVSRTGVINPVAVFDPVELEGTTVERASLHNVSIIEQLQLGIGDEVTVYKANMIIPQIDDNLTRSGTYKIPDRCPSCNGEVVVIQANDTKFLYCNDVDCMDKTLGKFTHFVSRECMNIDGLSEETLRKLIEKDLIYYLSDLYYLKGHKNAMMRIEGLGRKSVEKILSSIEESRKVKLNNFICALGIQGIGKKQAKQIAEQFGYEFYRFEAALDNHYDFTNMAGFGEILNNNIYWWYSHRDPDDYVYLCKKMRWEVPIEKIIPRNSPLNGKTFVVTGTVQHFANRKALQEAIESVGGKVSGSISTKTDYLVNNDPESKSSKNKKAKELGVRIITEDELMAMLKEKKENGN